MVQNCLTHEHPDLQNNQPYLDSLKEAIVSQLSGLDANQIQKKYIQEKYFDPRRIEAGSEGAEKAYKVIIKYIPWDKAVNDRMSTELKEIAKSIVESDEAIKNTSLELYSAYVLNTLPFRSSQNIKTILGENLLIPQEDQNKMKLALKFHEARNLDDNEPLNLITAKYRHTGEIILISMENLEYLNSINTEYGSNQFMLNLPDPESGQIISLAITADHLEEIIFPEYLHDLLQAKFSKANLVAAKLDELMNNIINQNKFQITDEQKKKLAEICYQVTLNLGADVTIPLAFKKDLMSRFKDDDFFRTIGEILPSLANKIDNNKENQPQLLIKAFNALGFTADIQGLITSLAAELNSSATPETNLNQHEIAYALGITFIYLSSIYGLGYHDRTESGDINMAFSRFRFLGAYCLAQSIVGNPNWTPEQKQTINKWLKIAVFEQECSGIIANRLWDNSKNTALYNIYNRIHRILQTSIRT